MARALKILGPRLLASFEIGCSFSATLDYSSLGKQFKASLSRCCVNAFHGYSHNYSCQVQNHPNNIEGMGLEDLEGMEHIFSGSNQLASVVRYASAYHRRQFIDLYLQQWDADKYEHGSITTMYRLPKSLMKKLLHWNMLCSPLELPVLKNLTAGKLKS